MTLPEAELSFYFAAAAQLEPALPPAFTECVATILQSHVDPGPGDAHRAVRQALIGLRVPPGGDQAAATALASRYAGFRAVDIDARFVTSETHFIYDLGADFLDRIELMIAIEDRFDVEITDDDIEQFQVVGDLISHLARQQNAIGGAKPVP